MESKVEVPVPMSIMKELNLEIMHAMLIDLLKKVDPNKQVFYLADPNNKHVIQPTSKELFDTFINDTVVEKKKIGEVSAKDRMIDLIYRISGCLDQARNENITKMKSQIDSLTSPVFRNSHVIELSVINAETF